MKARVEGGRLHLDEPCSLPEGTVLDLVLDDEGDDMDAGERQALHDAISNAWTAASRPEEGGARDANRHLR